MSTKRTSKIRLNPTSTTATGGGKKRPPPWRNQELFRTHGRGDGLSIPLAPDAEYVGLAALSAEEVELWRRTGATRGGPYRPFVVAPAADGVLGVRAVCHDCGRLLDLTPGQEAYAGWCAQDQAFGDPSCHGTGHPMMLQCSECHSFRRQNFAERHPELEKKLGRQDLVLSRRVTGPKAPPSAATVRAHVRSHCVVPCMQSGAVFRLSGLTCIVRLSGHVQVAAASYSLLQHQEKGAMFTEASQRLGPGLTLVAVGPDVGAAAVVAAIWRHGEVETHLHTGSLEWLREHGHLKKAALVIIKGRKAAS